MATVTPPFVHCPIGDPDCRQTCTIRWLTVHRRLNEAREIDQQMTSQKPTEHSTSRQPRGETGHNESAGEAVQHWSYRFSGAADWNEFSGSHRRTAAPGAAVSSTAAPTVAAVDQANYSVSFERIANDLDGNARYRVTTTGFAAGNWANLWVKSHDATQPGGQQDFGGALTNSAGNAIITASKEMPAGDHAIQVSVGAYPNEQMVAATRDQKSTQFTSVPNDHQSHRIKGHHQR